MESVPSIPPPNPPLRDEAVSREELMHRVTDMMRCKWTLSVLDGLSRGLKRPSELERDLPGITPKILHDRLAKLERYGLIGRRVFAEIPPRVEYQFTERGKRLQQLMATIRGFVESW